MFRKKRKPGMTGGQLTDKAAAQIATLINHLQNGFAAAMNKKTKHFSASRWKFLILVFAVAWGAFSLYTISTAFEKHLPASTHKTYKQLFIQGPMHNDSLELIERIYGQQKSEQLKKQLRQNSNTK